MAALTWQWFIDNEQRLRAMVCRYVGEHCADDIYSDVVIEAMPRLIENYTDRGHSPMAYVCTSLRGKILNHFRSLQRRPHVTATDADVVLETFAQSFDNQPVERVYDIVERACRDHRVFLIMRAEGFTISEIAQAFGVSYGSAQARVTEAMRCAQNPCGRKAEAASL